MCMPSLNNCNTRSQKASDIPLCRTTKRQKSKSFLGPKIWNKVSSNIKTAATTSSFTQRLKKEILDKFQESAILLIFLFLVLLFFSLIFWKLFFLLYFLRSCLQGDANENKNRFGSFLGHPCHFRSRDLFSFSFAFFCIFDYVVSNMAILFICTLSIFYDGEINAYIIRTYSANIW